MSSFYDNPNHLYISDDGGMLAEDQRQLEGLLYGSEQIAIDTRRNLRSLAVSPIVERIPDDWPTFPTLKELYIEFEFEAEPEPPCSLDAAAFPALELLNVSLSESTGNMYEEEYACTYPLPILEGRFEKLEEVTVGRMNMDADALESILCQPSLARLFLGYQKNDPCDGIVVVQTLQKHVCPKLTHLSLANCSIGNSACVELARALQFSEYSDIVDIRLGLKHSGADEVADVARTLRKVLYPNLTYIDLQYNNVGDQGCVALAQALEEGAYPQLEHLDLEGNPIGNEGCMALAQALQNGACPKLKYFVLEHSHGLGDEARAALLRGLENCPIVEARLPH